MRTAVVHDEEDLAALHGRVLRPEASGGRRRSAEDAIRAANPHLNLDQLRPGAVVILPDHPDIATEAGRAPGPVVADVHTTVSAARKAVSRAAAAANDRHAELRRALTAPGLAEATA